MQNNYLTKQEMPSVTTEGILDSPTISLRFRQTNVNISISYLNGISRYIHDNWQLDGFPRSYVKLATMPRTDNIVAFNITLPYRAIVMRAHIRDRKILSCNIEDHKGLPLDLDKQSFAWRQLAGRDDFVIFNFGSVESCVVEHKFSITLPSLRERKKRLFHQVVARLAQPINASFQYFQ